MNYNNKSLEQKKMISAGRMHMNTFPFFAFVMVELSEGNF